MSPFKRPPTIVEAMESESIWKPWFKNRASFAAWRAFLKTSFGLPLDKAELATFRQCTGRSKPRPGGYTEATLICGRRGGKSLILAAFAAYLATFRDWSDCLAPGERGFITVIAADKKQAGSIFRYLRAMLSVPVFDGLIERETQETVDLANMITVEVLTASYRTVRGRTIVAALCDELAFWRTDEDSSSPDVEIIAALKPAMSTVPGAVLLKASSPYAHRGVLWTDHQRHFGKDSATLVWQASTRTMNPTVSQAWIDEETEKDPANAAAEYGANFRSDLEAFVSREVVESVTMHGRYEIPPIPGVSYQAWCDPSGGSADGMTLAIASNEDGRIVLHAVREVVPPFMPSSVVTEFCTLLKSYGIAYVTGDRYAGMWPREQFLVHGISYRVADQTASEVYQTFLPMLNSRRVELLDHKKMRNQLIALERRTSVAGKDAIGHPKGGHDDVINSVAGACVSALKMASAPEFVWTGVPLSGGLAARREREAEARLQGQNWHTGLATKWNQVPRPEGYTERTVDNYLPRLREG